MSKLSGWKVVRLAVAAFCLLAILDVGGALAQSSQPLDILGVQLGMPREKALALLASHQPPYSYPGELREPVSQITLRTNKQDIYDLIILRFAPPPSESTVLSITRQVRYSNGRDAPSVDSFVRSLGEKLKSPTPSFSNSGRGSSHVDEDYVWTRDGKLLSRAELTSRLRDPVPVYCTNWVSAFAKTAQLRYKNFGDTCGTVASIKWDQKEGIITGFDMTFSDVTGTLSALSKADALADTNKASQHQQELQRANQNRPNL